MKKYKFIQLSLFLIFFLPLRLLAQEDITGIWKGTLFDDTTQQYLPYEIAISDDDGKLTGYSYTVFQGDKGEEIGIKSIRVKRKNDRVVIEDIDLIANTYTVSVSKKVRKLIDLILTIKDSVMILSGRWKTNYIRQYRPVTGSIEIRKKNNSWKEDPLIKKLDEMKLAENLSFVQAEKKQASLANNNSVPIKGNPEKKGAITVTNNRNKNTTSMNQSGDSSVTAVAAAPDKNENNRPPVVKAAADADKRKTHTIESVYFKTDSLVFTLYDNGVVDGDTVSILMNGNLIFSKQGLSEKPVSKTIYTKGLADSSLLILYAENLGSIPPNTGLLLIYDGKKRYEIFFSADLDDNAAVVLRRKKED